MRLLYVVQRYGVEVAGGAELACRLFAEQMAKRGHVVSALTSKAVSYVDWADHYDQSTEVLNGVEVTRLSVRHPRDPRIFNPLNGRVVWGQGRVPNYLQREWMRLQGPVLSGFEKELLTLSSGADVVIFFTYLYNTTWDGLRVVSGLVPTVLHPAAHDEPPLYVPAFGLTFHRPTALAFLTEEERDLVLERFRVTMPEKVVGIGMDLDVAGDGKSFRQTFGLGKEPYLLLLGRVEPSKGSDELFEFFQAYKSRHAEPLKLVVVGEQVRPLPPDPDVIVTGFIAEDQKRDAIAGAEVIVQPSYFESFSMVLTESWALYKPALVQGRCRVLEGQARRSGGALTYRGYGEFEAALETLLERPRLRESLGIAGRKYVEDHYNWDQVLDRYEDLLQVVVRPPPGP